MSRWLVGSVFICLLLPCVATAEDKFEGAVWRYSMKPAGSSDSEGERKGAFRIHKTQIFQPHEGQPKVIGTIEGKTRTIPDKGDKVKAVFTNLRCRSAGDTLACEGQITFQSKGEVTGRLIDSSGKHWVFRAARVQE